MAGNNVIRRDVVQIGFEVDQNSLNRVNRSLDDMQSDAVRAASSATDVADEVSRIGTSAEQAARSTNDLRTSADRLSNNGFTDAENDVDNLTSSIRTATRETMEFGDETRENSEESNDAVVDLTSSVGDLTGAFAGVAGAFAVGAIIQGINEVDTAMNRLQAQTGATSSAIAVYRDDVQDIYTSGNGQTIVDVADAMGLVNQQFKDLDNDTMRNITKDAMTLVDTFDADLNETLRGVNALMTNMGLSAEEAFNYIAKGTQNGLDKSHELSDNIAEYSQLWSQAGFSAQEMFTILQNGLDSGAYNLDKVNDFVKEFTISLSDGRIAENIDSFSDETQTLFEKWQTGGASQKEVFNSIINDLGNMTNEQEALTVASTVWSALGEDNAMKVITSLNKVNTTYADVEGTMQSINDVRYDDIGSSLERLKRTGGELLDKTLSPALSGINNALSEGLEWVNKFVDENEVLASGLTAAALAATGLTVGTIAFVSAANFIPPALAKVRASFVELNISMGPVGIALLAVSAAVGLVTAAVKASKDNVADYDGTLEECRYEIKRTEDAHRKAVERYGENSEAAKALEKDLDTLNAQYKKGGGYIAELQERIDETTESFKELSEAQDSAMDSIDKAEIQGYQAVSMLEALSGKANLTNSDLDAMSKYADYLNDTFNTRIVVDYEKGKLTGFDPKAIAQSIIDSANDKRVQSAWESLSGAEFTDGIIESIKVTKDAKKAYDEANKSWQENSEEMLSHTYWDEDLKEINDLRLAYQEAEKVQESYYSRLEEYGSIIDETGETTEMLREAFEHTAENGGDFISFMEESANATSDTNEAIDGVNQAVGEYNNSLYHLASAYDEALLAAQESVEGQYAVWEEVGDLAQTSVGDIQAALQSQSEYWSTYSDNLAILQEKAQGIEGLSDMIATIADGSEDSASAIAALAGASDADLSAVVANWQEVKSEQDVVSQGIADTATQFSEKVGEMGVEMQGLVSDMDMTDEATTNASNTINSFINTMITTINNRKGEVQSALDSLLSAANSYNINVSVPVEGNATGTTNSADTFIAGERGAELIVGKKGSTVFPASETNRIINAVQDYAGGYSPKTSVAGKVIQSNTTYAPQFTLNLNGASATDSNKRTVKRWIKESLNEVFNNLATDNQPLLEV